MYQNIFNIIREFEHKQITDVPPFEKLIDTFSMNLICLFDSIKLASFGFYKNQKFDTLSKKWWVSNENDEDLKDVKKYFDSSIKYLNDPKNEAMSYTNYIFDNEIECLEISTNGNSSVNNIKQFSKLTTNILIPFKPFKEVVDYDSKSFNDFISNIKVKDEVVSDVKEEKEKFKNITKVYQYFLSINTNYVVYFLNPQHKLNGQKISLILICDKILEIEQIYQIMILFRMVVNEELYEELRFTQTRSAINSILIDSYAHNISAHSLNFLQSLFNYRTEQYLKKHYSIPHFGRLENLPLNTLSYSDFLGANQKNKEDGEDALKHYKALGISDNSNTVFDATLLDYVLYSDKFKNRNGEAVFASDLLQYEDKTGKLPMPLDYAIAPLLTYLRDKGAFWSGVIRDNQATPSRIVSMYDLLMEMFNNPLFIGSIMAAEEFFVIHVFVDVEEEGIDGSKESENENESIEQKTNKRHLLTINIKEFVEAEMKQTGEGKTREEQESKGAPESRRLQNDYEYLNEGNYSNLNFVRLSKYHETLRLVLQEQTILLPGGDVGKHAFFTIVENTLRNAKHIVKEHRDAIKQNGLELHFQISRANFKCQQDGEELYQIGITLNYRNIVENKSTYKFTTPAVDAATEQFKMRKSVIRNSYQPILTDDGHSQMGGSSQDKVCAAALFNKTFTSVEYPYSEVEGYYPWIAYNLYPDSPASVKKNLIYNKISGKSSKEERRKYLEDEIKKAPVPALDPYLASLVENGATFNKNLYIKFFHIWKAKDVQDSSRTIKSEANDTGKFIDTIPRYKIAVVNDEDSKGELRKRAVIRIVGRLEGTEDHASTEAYTLESTYKTWNQQWLFRCAKYDAVKFEKDGTPIAIEGDLEVICVDDTTHLHGSNELIIKIDHDSGAEQAEVCKIRSHGAFLKHICGGASFGDFIKGQATIGKAQKQELLETVLTRIFIADNRLFSLVDNYTFGENKDKKKDKVLKETFHLNIVNEDNDTIDTLRSAIGIEELKNQHFLIFHLSYADELSEAGENRYEAFIDNVLDLKMNPLPPNTIIAMTTGRGREDWLDKTGRHRSHCIHVPIESLHTAIQHGVLFRDDFDIKYNLCKVLFGS